MTKTLSPSPAQTAYALDLGHKLRELAGTDDARNAVVDGMGRAYRLAEADRKALSSWLEGAVETLRNWQRVDRDAKQPENLEGMHILDGRIFKVQKAVHGSGRLYAKELVRTDDTTCGGCETCDGEDLCPTGAVEFVMAKGMIFKLSEATRLTLEQAKTYGALYGSCVVCGRVLTDEKSIEAGIGPVCQGKL